MKRIFLIVACLLLAICITSVAFAHSGRTDGSGGHWNHSTGEYHYHHGKPEHDHINGICPYDYEDTTSHHSSGYSSSKTKTAKIEDKEEPTNFWVAASLSALNAAFMGMPAGLLICGVLELLFPKFKPSAGTIFWVGAAVLFGIVMYCFGGGIYSI